MVLQIELLDGAVAELSPTITGNALDASEVEDVFFDGHIVKDGVGLWTVANQLLDIVKVFADVKSTNMDTTLSWFDFGCQLLESRRLTSTVYTEESEALTCLQAEGNILNGDKRLLNKVAAATRNLINLAQISHLYLELIIFGLTHAGLLFDHIRVKLQVFDLLGQGATTAVSVALSAALAKVCLNQE